MLQDRDSNMPFCLCWANENWTRRWDAKEHEILIAQDYSRHDDARFIDDLLPFLRDDRYIEVAGQKLLIVYRPQQIPNVAERTRFWRECCQSNGIQLHLCAALTHGNLEYRQFGFDSGVEFPPHTAHVTRNRSCLNFYSEFGGLIFDFDKIAQSYLDRKYNDPDVYKCVFPSWDNTARRNDQSLIVLDGTPENFELWLRQACEVTQNQFPQDKRFVFINAWNEWAEGCHLEPDRAHGRKFLEALCRVKEGRSTIQQFGVSREAQQNETQKPWGQKIGRELRRIRYQISERTLNVSLDGGGRLIERPKAQHKFESSVTPIKFRNRSSSVPDLGQFTDYDYEIDPSGESAGAFVVQLANDARKILEIGAGSGSITEHLVSPSTDVVALEINPSSIEKLKKYTQHVYQVDLNQCSWPDTLSGFGKFDAVIAADVLEHLYDPWTVLKGMKSLLSKSGSVILSLSHLGHCAALASLIQGDFEYKDWGLLDKTHIRFFGVHDIQALYESAGLAIVDVRFVTCAPERTEFGDKWTALPRHLKAALSSGPYSNVYQVVAKAIPVERVSSAVKIIDLPLQINAKQG
jgi:2-polyprenyl-3-methyl-5-hydroxy-6-metoxy-1,4-benzoquinol methylase